jgi:hypothetical protein
MKPRSVGWTLLLLAAAATAQTSVYRCGPQGREYSQEPCATGVALDLADPRSAAQRHQTQAAVARDIRLAETLAKERLRREQAASRQGAAHIGPSRGASAPDARARPKAPRKPDGRRARDGGAMMVPLKAFGAPA